MKRLAKHFNPATALAVVALVFAMTGGAFALGGHGPGAGPRASAAKSTTKSKGKPGPRGATGPKGATGPVGPAGPAGAAGAKGENGAKGEAGAKGETGAAGVNGTDGKNGESVVSTALAPGEGGCLEGGSKFTVGGKETTACNGEKGEAAAGGGYPKTLPAGETETGSFSAFFEKPGADVTYTSISFPIKLPIALGPSEEYYVSIEEQQNGKAPAACSGSGENPTAAKGNLCVYEGYSHEDNGEEKTITKLKVTTFLKSGAENFVSSNGASTTGALLRVKYEGEAEGVVLGGTWAVDAP